jgi:23S rRNA pseudouridine2604 synthase
LRVVLRQGINRQIRRMFEVIGYQVKHLVRTRMGDLRLGELPKGHWRPLSRSELARLNSSVAPAVHHRRTNSQPQGGRRKAR